MSSLQSSKSTHGAIFVTDAVVLVVVIAVVVVVVVVAVDVVEGALVTAPAHVPHKIGHSLCAMTETPGVVQIATD